MHVFFASIINFTLSTVPHHILCSLQCFGFGLDPDPGRKKFSTTTRKEKNLQKFMCWGSGCSFWRAGWFCSSLKVSSWMPKFVSICKTFQFLVIKNWTWIRIQWIRSTGSLYGYCVYLFKILYTLVITVAVYLHVYAVFKFVLLCGFLPASNMDEMYES